MVELVRLLQREVTILLIELDMGVALELAERVTVHYGRVVADRPTETVRRDPLDGSDP